MDPLYIDSNVLEIQRSMHISFSLLHMFIPNEVFTTDCSRVRGLSTLGHVCPHRFQAFRLRLCFLFFLDFKCSSFLIRCSDFAFAFIFYRSGVWTLLSYGSNVQTLSASLLLAPQLRRSNFIFYRSGIQTLPLYGSDVQTSSALILLAPQLRRSNFVFCRSSFQTSPSYGSDVQTSSVSHLLAP